MMLLNDCNNQERRRNIHHSLRLRLASTVHSIYEFSFDFNIVVNGYLISIYVSEWGSLFGRLEIISLTLGCLAQKNVFIAAVLILHLALLWVLGGHRTLDNRLSILSVRVIIFPILVVGVEVIQTGIGDLSWVLFVCK